VDAAFVLADSLQYKAERGADQAIKEVDGYQGGYEHHVVVLLHGVELQAKEPGHHEGRTRYAYQPIVATRHRTPLPNQGVDHHAERERKHGEVYLGMTHT